MVLLFIKIIQLRIFLRVNLILFILRYGVRYKDRLGTVFITLFKSSLKDRTEIGTLIVKTSSDSLFISISQDKIKFLYSLSQSFCSFKAQSSLNWSNTYYAICLCLFSFLSNVYFIRQFKCIQLYNYVLLTSEVLEIHVQIFFTILELSLNTCLKLLRCLLLTACLTIQIYYLYPFSSLQIVNTSKGLGYFQCKTHMYVS